jgi:aminoglycoside 6-adenylyltransferase
MRTEQEMIKTVVSVAKKDERVRAAYMYGSRACASNKSDSYSDYDIAYVVTETESFLDDKEWLSNFGDITFALDGYRNQNSFLMKEVNDLSRRSVWSMLFSDGNRIDLLIEIIDEAKKHKHIEGEAIIVLLDKDCILPENTASSDKAIPIIKPHENQYTACCSGFWWFISYIAIGVARNQLPYVVEWFISHNSMTLKPMLEWYIGVQTDFTASKERDNRYYEKYLSADLHDLYVKTFSNSDRENLWNAIYSTCELFSKTASSVGNYFGFTYNRHEEASMMEYLDKIENGAL